LTGLLAAAFRGAFLAVVLLAVVLLAVVLLAVVLLAVVLLALLRRVFFFAAIRARSLLDSMPSGRSRLADRLDQRVTSVPLLSRRYSGCGGGGEP
jgi:cobalamin biosynthesis protein CobD/CbiB